jgi:fluoride exporter
MPGNLDDHAPRANRWLRMLRGLGAADPLPIDPDLAPDDAGEPSLTHQAGVPHPSRARPPVLAAVVVGGILGTAARYGVDRGLPASPGSFPTATFIVNCSGAFLLGLLLTALLERTRPAPHLRAFAATGVLGGWTTYSTMAVDATTLGHEGHLAMAAVYLVLTLVVGLTATTVGIALGRSRSRAPKTAGEGASR